MGTSEHIAAFIERTKGDPRISIVHIGIFTALAYQCAIAGNGYKCILNRDAFMAVAKISSTSTYYKFITELAAYGYINYRPSKHPATGSWIEIPLSGNNKNKES